MPDSAAPAGADALLFPGQGSQAPGMREAVAAHRPDLLELVTELVGADPFERLDQGTNYLQPAIFCASIASWEVAGSPRAIAYAGHSLGELAALVAAGSLDPVDGARLAARRGELMQQAGESGAPSGMLAVLGDDAAARQIAASCDLVVANDNAPGQLILSGPTEALGRASELAREAGVKRISLPVAGAFHSPAMAPAVDDYREELSRVRFNDPIAPVISCTTAQPFADIRSDLAAGLTSPVRWRETLHALHDLGARRFVEVGPGKVLTNLVKRNLEGVEAITLEAQPSHV